LKIELALIAALIAFCLLGAGCTAPRDFNKNLNQIIRPYRFSIAQWEASAFAEGVRRIIGGRDWAAGEDIERVKDYFDIIERIKALTAETEAIRAGNKTGDLASLESELGELRQKRDSRVAAAEKIIAAQIKSILNQQEIYHPADRYVSVKVNFPPLNFKLERPPHLLVISPRDRIESMREIVLRQEVEVGEMEQIEGEIDMLGVSSIVVGLGGFGGTYPAFVTNEASLRFTVDSAAEEWLHQYLFFRPMGFRYALDVLGIKRDYEIATLNETAAGIMGREIGQMVMESYYPDLKEGKREDDEKPEFDFNREMRDIRREVDGYLARGEIEQAEAFMEERRQFLASKGYRIRKLNQAYFAFHGAYADRPTSVSPIGDELKRLREQSDSLKEFLETVSSITSRQDLLERLE
jgi:hypothetical protein